MEERGKRILLVEDDRFLRRACEASLRQRGFSVGTAADGEAALRAVEAVPPDLILLDLLMPKMTGAEVLRALRGAERTRHIRVLILTNSSREQDIQELMALGISGYLVKADLSLQQVGDRVAQVLEA